MCTPSSVRSPGSPSAGCCWSRAARWSWPAVVVAREPELRRRRSRRRTTKGPPGPRTLCRRATEGPRRSGVGQSPGSVPVVGLVEAPGRAGGAVPVLDVDQSGIDLPVRVGGLDDPGGGPGRVEELRNAVGGAGRVLCRRVPVALRRPQLVEAAHLGGVAKLARGVVLVDLHTSGRRRRSGSRSRRGCRGRRLGCPRLVASPTALASP